MRILHRDIAAGPLAITAALSVVVLVGVLGTRAISLLRANADTSVAVAAAAGAIDSSKNSPAAGADWQQEMTLLGIPTNIDPSATSTNDTIAMIGPVIAAELLGQYAGLSAQGTVSSSTLAAAGTQLAPSVRAIVTYKTYAPSEIKVDSNTSYERMLLYRADLRDALAPLLKNTSAEFEIYAKYVQTGDPVYLAQLEGAAANYRQAAINTAGVTVPQDAIMYHIAILNAMQEFAAVLDGMTSHGSDAIASAALLRSYNKAEQDMLNSFNNLASYYTRKTP